MEEETLIIEQLSNYICLVITRQRPDLDKIRVAINEKFPSQNDLNREQRVIVPSIPVNGEIRVTFKLKNTTFYHNLGMFFKAPSSNTIRAQGCRY